MVLYLFVRNREKIMNWNPKNAVFICKCNSDEHQFLFRLWDFGIGETREALSKEIEMWEPEDLMALDITVFLPDYPGFFKRIWLGIKYVFGYKCKYGHFDVIEVKYEDVDRMMDILKEYKSKVENYRNMRK